MAFDRVTSVSLRPDRAMQFLDQVARLARAAAEKGESWHWTAHQTFFGEGLTLHFSSRAESFEEIERQGDVNALWLRTMGEAEGAEGFARANECIQSLTQTISVDRPELSVAEDMGSPADHPYAVVTVVRARPGHAEAAEELIRKIAEAIPKVGDPARMLTFQVMFGEIGVYWSARPLHSLADLDRQLPAPELLSRAFGHAEGGLLWRSGTEAIEHARREILRYAPELSHPPQD